MLLGEVTVGLEEAMPELLGRGLWPVPQPPVALWVPSLWITWSLEPLPAQALCSQQLAAVGATSQAWRLQEKHLYF